MGNFNRDDRRPAGGFKRRFGGEKSFGGGRSFGGGSRFGGRDGGRPPMHEATCSACGASCQLPFRPTGERPVFCSTCFDKQGGNTSRPSRFGGDRQERPRFEDKQMHDATCSKCGKDCQVPFKPMAGKDVFCSDCFEKGGSKGTGEILEQIKMLGVKIDKLTALVSSVNGENNKVVEKRGEVASEKVVGKKKDKIKTKSLVKKSSEKKRK